MSNNNEIDTVPKSKKIRELNMELYCFSPFAVEANPKNNMLAATVKELIFFHEQSTQFSCFAKKKLPNSLFGTHGSDHLLHFSCIHVLVFEYHLSGAK